MGLNEKNGGNSPGDGNVRNRLETLASFLAIATFITLFGCFMFEWGYFSSKNISIVDIPVSILDFDATLTRIFPIVLIYLTMFLIHELTVVRFQGFWRGMVRILIWIIAPLGALALGILFTRDDIPEFVVICGVMLYAAILVWVVARFEKDIKLHQDNKGLLILLILCLAGLYILGLKNYELQEWLSKGQHRICTKEAVFSESCLVADDFRSFSEWIFVWKKAGEAVWVNRASVTAIIPVRKQSKAVEPRPMSSEPEREADFQREESLKGRDLGSSEDDRDASDRADKGIGEDSIPRGGQRPDGHQAGGPGGQGAAEGIPGEGSGPVEGANLRFNVPLLRQNENCCSKSTRFAWVPLE